MLKTLEHLIIKTFILNCPKGHQYGEKLKILNYPYDFYFKNNYILSSL